MQSRFFSFDTNSKIVPKDGDPALISPLSITNVSEIQLSVGDPTIERWVNLIDSSITQIVAIETKFDELMKKPPSPISVSPMPTLAHVYAGAVNESLDAANDIKKFKTILIEKINKHLAIMKIAHKELQSTNQKIVNREKDLSFETKQNSVATLTQESLHLAQRVKVIIEKAQDKFSAAEVYDNFNKPIEDTCRTLLKVIADLNKHHANWLGYRQVPLPRIHV